MSALRLHVGCAQKPHCVGGGVTGWRRDWQANREANRRDKQELVFNYNGVARTKSAGLLNTESEGRHRQREIQQRTQRELSGHSWSERSAGIISDEHTQREWLRSARPGEPASPKV